MFCGVRQESHMAGLLQRHTQPTLVFGTGASLTTWLNLPPVRNVALKKAAGIFVINLTHMVMTELTNFAASAALTTWTPVATWPLRSSLHELFLLQSSLSKPLQRRCAHQSSKEDPCTYLSAGVLRKVV